ncbi:phage protein [Ochrobactrum chromiisoli]|uniref:DUF3277 family protein n=1 Tax=Ochrobactrum chromiisoli TaxID=2993941 RepID=A0ABT3QUG2_9HYPH|nr:phage protein [Ochrobactrum chromiisoli]MCX2699256.1 DUF3277 family protein [Ochrobactrum chromiisoli]
MSTYSFIDVVASLSGPGGVVQLGYGAASAEEGISIDMVEDKNTMMIGAGGEGQHNLHAGRAGTITIACLKVSPTNQQMMALYNYQQQSSARWGQNVLTLRNTATGDSITAVQGAFKKLPKNTFSKDGPMMEWALDFVKVDQMLGSGTPALLP